MSYEMEELGRRASVVVREPSNEDDGYNEDDEYEDEYELDNLDGSHVITNVPPGIVVTDESGGRARSKSKSSHKIDFYGYSMYNNNSISNNTNITTTNNPTTNNSDDEDAIDDDDDDYEDDDEDYYDDEVNNPLNYYKSVPRTLPQIDIFTQRNQKKDENDIEGVNRPTEGYFRNRNQSQVSAFLLKGPVTKLSGSNNSHNGLVGPGSITSKTGRFRKSDRLSSKASPSIGYSTDTDSYFIRSKNAFCQNSGSTVSANIDNNQIIHRLVARPPVDNQDKLLAEMAILNDVKRKAKEGGIYDAFPEGIEEKLRDLRQSHVKVIQLLREREAKAEEQKRRAIQANNNALTAGNSNNTVDNSMSDNDVCATDKITRIPSSSFVEAREVGGTTVTTTAAATTTAASGPTSGGGGATSASITTSGNQMLNIIREMPAPGLMSNPDTSRYIDTLVNTIKEL